MTSNASLIKKFRTVCCAVLVASLLPLGCAHSGGAPAPVGYPGPPRLVPALPGEMRTLGSSGPLFVQRPCVTADSVSLPGRNQPQVELGLAFWRTRNSAATFQSVPYAGYRCGSH